MHLPITCFIHSTSLGHVNKHCQQWCRNGWFLLVMKDIWLSICVSEKHTCEHACGKGFPDVRDGVLEKKRTLFKEISKKELGLGKGHLFSPLMESRHWVWSWLGVRNWADDETGSVSYDNKQFHLWKMYTSSLYIIDSLRCLTSIAIQSLFTMCWCSALSAFCSAALSYIQYQNKEK